ncbi:MAG: RNA polymerase sigma factor [candidate division WOR-3 bacterium]
MPIEDSMLVERAKQGDRTAFDELVRRYRGSLVNFCASRLASKEDAHAVVQQIFYRAWRSLQGFRGESSFSTWLHQIAFNEVNRYLAERKAAPDFVSLEEQPILHQGSEPPPIQLPHLLEQFHEREIVSHLFQAAKQVCTPAEYQILGLFYQGHDFNLISELLGMKPTTVRTHFLRARLKLIAYLFQHDLAILGGLEAVHFAFSRACQAAEPSHRLTTREAAVFKQVILHKQPTRWSQRIFRQACFKVARYLPLELGD